MCDVGTWVDEVDVSQPMDMQEEGAVIYTCLVPLRTLMDIDTVVSRHMPPTEAVTLTVTSKTSKEKLPQREARGPYRRTLRIKSSNCLTT